MKCHSFSSTRIKVNINPMNNKASRHFLSSQQFNLRCQRIFPLFRSSMFSVNQTQVQLIDRFSAAILLQFSFLHRKKTGNNKTIRLWRFKSFFEIFGNIWKLVFMTCWIDIESNSIQRHIDSFQQSISTFSTRFYLNRTSVGFFVVWFPLEIG